MDEPHDNSNPLGRWFQTLSAPQRRLVPVAVVAGVLAGGWLATHRTQTGASLTLPQGLAPAAAVAHLAERGIADAKSIAGGKISVPAAKTADAKRFLEELAAVSTSWADEWEKTNSQLGQFSGNRERESAKEIARARMIGRLLRQMPGISQADVVWDEEETAGWRGPQKTRCTVYLRPKTGFEITADMARSVRQAVAGSKKHLASEDIVVMDLDRMTTFDAVPNGVDDATRSLAERDVVDLRQQIESALRDCPGVRVNVGVTWQEKSEGPTVALSPVVHRGSTGRNATLISSNGFLEELSRDESANANGAFSPVIQVTVTAPEDAAANWATRATSPQKGHARKTEDVLPAGFERPVKGKAADTIRQSVCSVLSRFDRRNLATGVSVHLTPAAGVAAAIETIPETPAIDPLWFMALALAGCVGGAWVLSSAFGGEPVMATGPAPVADSLLDTITTTPSVAARSPSPFEAALAATTMEPPEFEDLIDCGPEMWQELWDNTDHTEWVAALKGSSTQLRRVVLASLDVDAAAELQNSLASAPGLRLADIDAAQQSLRFAAANLLERAA